MLTRTFCISMERPQAVSWLPPICTDQHNRTEATVLEVHTDYGPYLRLCGVTLTMRTEDSEPRLSRALVSFVLFLRSSPGSGKRSRMKIKPAYELRGGVLCLAPRIFLSISKWEPAELCGERLEN